MNMEQSVSQDVWNAVKDNYEKGSYTTAITNVLQYANEVVRDKSNLSFDNTKLMDIAFLGQSPILKINKFQTQTEKDIQQGIGFLLKGLCLAVRNPRAHERYNDSKETADTIIPFVSFILEYIRDSKQPALVEDWLKFVFDENFNNTKKYAEYVLDELPDKKRYDMLVSIFRNRSQAKPTCLNNLVNLLLEAIKPDEYKEFMDNINKELLYCKNDNNLRMFLSLFPPEKWSSLVPLTRLKIENMVKESIDKGQMIYDDGYYCSNKEGELSTWAASFIDYFETKNDILTLLGYKLKSDDAEIRDFVEKNFSGIFLSDDNLKNSSLQYGIKKSIEYFDKDMYENIDFICSMTENKEIKAAFADTLSLAKTHFDKEGYTGDFEEIPSDDDLPF